MDNEQRLREALSRFLYAYHAQEAGEANKRELAQRGAYLKRCARDYRAQAEALAS